MMTTTSTKCSENLREGEVSGYAPPEFSHEITAVTEAAKRAG
jgi:hypothetical protein